MVPARLARQRETRSKCVVDIREPQVDRRSPCAPQLGAIESRIPCLGEVPPRLLANPTNSDRLFHRIFRDDNIRRWCTASRTAPPLVVATRLEFRFRITSRFPPSLRATATSLPSRAKAAQRLVERRAASCASARTKVRLLLSRSSPCPEHVPRCFPARYDHDRKNPTVRPR